MIAILDYGIGNVRSVKNALDALGEKNIITYNHNLISRATHLILPGVGAFTDGLKGLKKNNLIGLLKEEIIVKKKLFLGICLGMQMLGEKSEENSEVEGLCLIKGLVKKFHVNEKKIRIPHIGWNDIKIKKGSRLFKDVAIPEFYFVHSYFLQPKNKTVVTGTCNYGQNFCCAVEKENILGVQFHPEKSQRAGLTVLKNFAQIKYA